MPRAVSEHIYPQSDDWTRQRPALSRFCTAMLADDPADAKFFAANLNLFALRVVFRMSNVQGRRRTSRAEPNHMGVVTVLLIAKLQMHSHRGCPPASR